ncbi:hypothetical protein EYF80_054680 [Liparis tanakae]|uniref:Uncharacterized protein n=1 Tax=Liparis tanakae TaxID=230148 RepID=A0A4Z2F293_9TELE|nr:hypothetical protein EYF80_054680 [Liparis tanakae]
MSRPPPALSSRLLQAPRLRNQQRLVQPRVLLLHGGHEFIQTSDRQEVDLWCFPDSHNLCDLHHIVL